MADSVFAMPLPDSNILHLVARLKEECQSTPHPKVTKFEVRDAKLKECMTTMNRIICEIWSWLDDFIARSRINLTRQKQYVVVADYVNVKMLKRIDDALYDRLNQDDFEVYVNESIKIEQLSHAHVSRGYSTSTTIPGRSPPVNDNTRPEASGMRSRRVYATPRKDFVFRTAAGPTIPHQTSDPTPLTSSNVLDPRPKGLYGAGPDNDFVLFTSPEQSRYLEPDMMKTSDDELHSSVPRMYDQQQGADFDTSNTERLTSLNKPNTRCHNTVSLGNPDSRGQKRGRDGREFHVKDRVISSELNIQDCQGEASQVAREDIGSPLMNRALWTSPNNRSGTDVNANEVMNHQSFSAEAVRGAGQDFTFDCKRAMTSGDGFISLDKVQADGLAMTRTMSSEEVLGSVRPETRKVNRPSWFQPSKSVPVETFRRGGSMPTTR